MFLPIADDNPSRHRSVVNWTLIGLCALVFLWQFSLPPNAKQAAVYAFGVIPAVLFGQADLPPGLQAVPDLVTPVTSMFLHGGLLHLGGNMLYLWLYGDNVEDCFGHVRYAIFYTVCGIVAVLAHGLMDPSSQTPLIGASGAISGVMGAYLLLHPFARIKVLIWFFIVTIVWVPAWAVLLVYFVVQVFSLPGGEMSGVAFMAHIGGFVCGVILTPFFRRPGVKLLARSPMPPPSGFGGRRRTLSRQNRYRY